MLKNRIINLKVIETVAHALQEINDEVVYVGGAVVSLYATDSAAEEARPTSDIDISVQIHTYAQMQQLQERLAKKKIFPAIGESVMYRYVYEDILIDFIPFEDTPLGLTNRWLKPGFKVAYRVDVGNIKIKILPVPLFLCTKWETFKNRGNDPRASHDFEDIIYIFDNNLELLQRIEKSEKQVKEFLKEMSTEILRHHSLNEIIECHINPYTAAKRKEIIIEKLKKISALQL